MEKLSFRSKKPDPGEHVLEEGGHPSNKPYFSPPSKQTEEAGSPLHAFSLDLRSLALFRVMTALVIIVDLLSRSRHLFAHYANLGVWPIVEAINNINAHSFSFHFSNGNIPFQVVMTVVSVLVAVLLLVGYRTRVMTVLMWLLTLSLHNRNILVLDQGDNLLRMLLFWGMFLPLGDRFSVDQATQSSASPLGSNRHLSLSSLCFIVQIAIVYWVGYMLKTGIEWEEGTAMYYLFSIDQYTTPFGYFVLRFPNFLVLLTNVYLWFELLMPVLIVFPIANSSARTTACFASFGIYSFLSLCLELGMFPCAPMLASLALLPASFWDKMLPSFTAYVGSEYSKYWTMGGSITLYYSTSGLYTTNTKFFLQVANTFLGLNSPILAADKTGAQQDESNENEPNSSDVGRFLSDNGLQWVAVDANGKRHVRHRGVLALLSENPITSFLAPILFKIEKPVAFVYNLYAFVANIPLVQNFTQSFIPHGHASSYPTISTRRGGCTRARVSDLVAVGFLVYILWFNAGTVNTDIQMSGGTQWLAHATRIDQWWSMFAPYPLSFPLSFPLFFLFCSFLFFPLFLSLSRTRAPMKDDGWFVIPARLANGKEVDLLKPGGGSISYEKPTFVSRSFPDSRWRRYLMNLWSGAHQEKRLFYGRYLCRQWNWYGKGSQDKDYLLKTFRIVYLREITLPNYKVKGPEPIVLWEHQC